MNKIRINVRVTELGDTALRLVELYKREELLKNDMFLVKIFIEIEEKAQEITIAVKRDIVYSKLEEADTKRDKAIRVFSKLLKGYESIPVEELRNHAQKLMAIFKKYGMKITNENYTSQSNLIASLLEELSAAELQISIEKLLGIKEAIDDIREKQNAFIQLRSAYEAELANRKSKANATALKKPLLELINKKLVPYVSAMSIAQPELFREFIGKFSEIINSTNVLVKNRGKK